MIKRKDEETSAVSQALMRKTYGGAEGRYTIMCSIVAPDHISVSLTPS